LVIGTKLFDPGHTLAGVTINGNLSITNGQALIITNGFACSGGILFEQFGTLVCRGNQAITAGTFVLGTQTFGGGRITLYDNTATLTLGPAVSVRGQLGIINFTRTGTIINQGLISADTPNAALSLSAQNFINDTTGIIEATAAGAKATPAILVWPIYAALYFVLGAFVSTGGKPVLSV
jgi:hypothetical protein